MRFKYVILKYIEILRCEKMYIYIYTYVYNTKLPRWWFHILIFFIPTVLRVTDPS